MPPTAGMNRARCNRAPTDGGSARQCNEGGQSNTEWCAGERLKFQIFAKKDKVLYT